MISIDELHIHLNFHNERIFIMKTVAKVFIILGMIFQFYMIFPIILGAIALSKLKKATCKDDFGTGWAIVTLICVNLIAGIILLVMKDEDYAKI